MGDGAARVRWYTNDMSGFVPNNIVGYFIMVLQTERGPVGVPQVVDSQSVWSRKFGRKVPWTTDPLIAEMCLREGGRLIVIRACAYDDINDPTSITALTSSVTVQDRGGDPLPAVLTATHAGPYVFTSASGGSGTGTEVGPFTIGTGTNDKMLVVVGAGLDQTVTLSPGALVSASTIVDALNAGTTDITWSAVDDKIHWVANDVADSITFKDIEHDCYSTFGIQVKEYAEVEGTDSLVVSINGGADQTFTLLPASGSASTFALSSSQLATQLATLTDARATSVNGKLRLQTTLTGDTRTIQVQATSTSAEIIGLDTEEHAGFEGIPEDTLTFESKDPGAWGNYLSIVISDSTLNPDDRFDVKIVYSLQGELSETYTNLSMDPTSLYYAVNYINERSALVTVTDEGSSNISPANRPANSQSGYLPTGGCDSDAMTPADWIGSAVHQTGMYAIDNVWSMAMDFAIPGTNSPTVYNAMTAYAESRQDLVAYGNIPANMTPEEAVDWRFGNGYNHPAFNSHRFALFYGMPLVYDDMDDSRKYISNLGHLAANLCKSDTRYNESYAFVGAKRGTVTLMEGIDFNIQSYRSTGYADLFAEAGINYLFISKIRGIEGGMFWEQATTLRDTSSMQGLNVVRMITSINRSLMPCLWIFIFDPNHPITWRAIYRELLPAFQDWKDRYQIYDFAIQCDELAYFSGGELKNAVLNSGLDISRGIYNCRALIQPTEVIRYLDFTLGITRAGEAFEQWNDVKQLPGYIRA